MNGITQYLESNLTLEQSSSILTLTTSIWPKNKTVAALAQELIESAATGDDGQSPKRFAIWEDGKMIAHAKTFVREIFWSVNHGSSVESMMVLALAAVCTDPAHRAKGLGVAIVERAFQQLDSRVRISLFQTGVPGFYEKLGCRIVHNKFVNGRNRNDPDSNPWWDRQVMIYPAGAAWPQEKVDLNGPGY